MAAKKMKAFRIMLDRGKLNPILVGVERGSSAEDVLALYLDRNSDNLVPGNDEKLDCGHKSISIRYYAEAV